MGDHIYIRVHWIHEHPDEPIDFWSELDGRRFEVRKVELWRDGRVGFADVGRQSGGTRLGTEPVPPIIEVAAQDEFSPEEIDQFSFERCWRTYVR